MKTPNRKKNARRILASFPVCPNCKKELTQKTKSQGKDWHGNHLDADGRFFCSRAPEAGVRLSDIIKEPVV